MTISTTLVSYLLIFPALWRLRATHPDTPRPFRMPAYRALTTMLMVLLGVTVAEIMAPGAGISWFGSGYAPDGWARSERWTYLLTQLVPVLIFMLIGLAFYLSGAPTRRTLATLDAEVASLDADQESHR